MDLPNLDISYKLNHAMCSFIHNVYRSIIHNSPEMETNAHQLMNGQAKYGIFIQWNIIWQEKGVKY